MWLWQREEVIIIASSDIRYLYFREKLENTWYKNISNNIYKSLDDLEDDSLYKGKRLVFCENKLYYPYKKSHNTTIIPISLEHTEEIIYEFICK